MNKLLLLLLALPQICLADPICTDDSAAKKSMADAAFAASCEKIKSMSPEKKAEVIEQTQSHCSTELWNGAKQGLQNLANLPSDVYELSKSLASGVANKVGELWNSGADPVSGSIAAADASVDAQAKAVEQAKLSQNQKTDMRTAMVQEINRSWDIFWCLPPEIRLSTICGVTAEITTEFAGPGVAIKGVVKGAQLATSVGRVLNASRTLEGTEGMTAAQKLDSVAYALKTSESRGKELRRLGDMNLVEYTNPRGDRILKVEEYFDQGGTKSLITREVLLDAKTGAIDANSEQGRALLNKLVAQSKKGDKQSLIFLDVNNLGKTNYFEAKTAAGDAYLKSVGDSVRSAIRPGDVFFKLGGDELVIVANSGDAKTVQDITQRIVTNVDKNADTRKIFRNEVVNQANEYRAVARAANYESLPYGLRGSLTEEQAAAAQTDLSGFKKEVLPAQLDKLTSQAGYRGSVSVGSTTLGSSDDLASALARAEKQATDLKIQYKDGMGLDVGKYGGKAGGKKPRYSTKPQVLPPVEAP